MSSHVRARRCGPVIAVAAASFAGVAVPVSLVGPTAVSCRTTARTVIVNLPNARDRQVLRHVWAATAAGQPGLLHIARDEVTANRRASLRGVPAWGSLTDAQRRHADPDHWREPHDRDEYPPAMSDEGGRGADVAYVLSVQNRSAGSIMGDQLAAYCDGQRFRFERKPGPR